MYSTKNIWRGLIAVILAVLVVAGLFAAGSHGIGRTPLARAFGRAHGALAGISSIFKAPFFGTSTQSIAPLYKPAADYENAVVDAVKRISPAVVSITISNNVPFLENCKPQDIPGLPTDLQQLFGGYVTCDNGSRVQDVGGGSGFIISKDGIILTNKHVVVDGNASYTVFTNDGKKYPAKVLGRDPVQDLAVMKIDGADLPIVTLGNSDSLELGQTAIAIGNALGEFRNTVSVGVISGLGRSITAVGDNTSETIQGVVQTDAAINPGNSGGPLINLHGEVIGVNVATAQGAQSVGFALPVNSAKHDIQTALAGGQIKASYLGVRYTMLSAVLAGQKKLDVSYGALLAADQNGAAVVKDSPADKVGLKEGDVILAIDGGSLEGKDLGQVIQNRNVGDVLHLDVFRAKRTIAVDVTLGERGQ
jgi:serine protease Do